MYVVPAHRVYAVGLAVHDVLVVEEELVRTHQLRLARAQLVRDHAVLQDVRELQVVVRDRLPPEHYHRIRIDHVEPDEPYFFLGHYMYNLPVAPLGIQLLNACAIGKRLIAYRVYISLSECAAVGPADSLRQLRQRLLPLGLYVK